MLHSKSPDIGTLFMDELCNVVKSDSLNLRVEKWICELLTDEFQVTDCVFIQTFVSRVSYF